MLTASDLEVRAGAHLLLSGTHLEVGRGEHEQGSWDGGRDAAGHGPEWAREGV